MRKICNGVEVEMTQAEIAEHLAMQAAASCSAVPQIVAMAAARKALRRAGISKANVKSAIDAIADAGEREESEIDWEYATEVRRSSPLVHSLGGRLGLTPEQIDALFLQAAGIS